MFSPEGYRALTEAAAVVRRGDRGVLAVSGADRVEWLQGLVTNDVAALRAGHACDAAYLTPHGRMISDLRIVNTGERLLLDVPAPLAESLQARLEALIFAEDANVSNESALLEIIEVHGPDAPRAVSGLDLIRDDAYGVPGFCAFVPAGEVDTLLSRLEAAGALRTSLETLDVLRIEAGRPAFLVDMDEHTIPLEAGIEDRAISFTKGCYVGQEIIVRVVHRGGGRVARRLVGFRFSKAALPAAGDVVRADGREIGRLTSATRSPTLELPIALGYVHRDFAEPGTTVEVSGQSGMTPAEVVELPFVNRRVAGGGASFAL